MLIKCCVLLCCFALVLVTAKNEDYKRHKVYKVKLQNQEQEDNFSRLKIDEIDYWRVPSFKYGTTGLAMVPPSHLDWFEKRLEELNINLEIQIEDVYEYLADKEKVPVNISRKSKERNFNFEGYYQYNEDANKLKGHQMENEHQTVESNISNTRGITDPLLAIKKDLKLFIKIDITENQSWDLIKWCELPLCHESHHILNYLYNLEESYSTSTTISLEIVEFDKTDEDRPLIYLKINSRDAVSANKPIVFIEAAINPREWITIPAAINIVNKLLEDEQRRFLDKFEWIVIPVANPDGYEYTHTNLRLWMKNRSTRSSLGFICPGVNINRNFDIAWLISGASSSSCSHLYGGVDTFSEPESQMIRSLIDEHGTRIRLYFSVQNNGGFVSYPWNYERAATGLFRAHHLLGLQMVNAMNADYKLGPGSIVVDRASGTSVDYARINSIEYSYNIDIEQYEDGIEIPAANIGGVVEDVWRAVSVAAEYVSV